MQYKCENCNRRFEFDDFIEFCPYCGATLNISASGLVAEVSDSNIVQEIDSIWGDSARIKKEFSNLILCSMSSVNDYADRSIRKTLPKQDLSNYEKNYSIIKQSNNRKTLINRIDKFLGDLDSVIDNLHNSIPADIPIRLEQAAQDTEEMIRELYNFLGQKYIPSNVDFSSEENYSAEILYSREQLRNLYDLVLIAYSKYKKCVEDNNMFAAFASTSNYGMMPDYWRRWFNNLSKEDVDKEDDEKEDPQYEQVVDYMKIHNAEKYFGVLDEDFIPHVDAFWYGLEMLCEFIDHHIAIKCNTKYFYISADKQSQLMRKIASKEFDVSEARLESAIELKERFENHLKKLNKKSKGDNSNGCL